MATPERPLPPVPREKGDSSSLISRAERKKLLGELRQQGIITPLTVDDREGIKRERELARRDLVPVDEVEAYIQSRLTPISLQDQQESIPIDSELRDALEKGSSSLIGNQVLEQLKRTKEGKVPLKSWLLNPRAVKRALEAKAHEAAALAEVRRAISDVTRRMAEVAGDNARRDALLNDIKDLEEALGPYVEPFCQERNLPVPPKNTLQRMWLLQRINAEMSALQVKGSEIAKKGEELVTEQVNIQGEIARNKMIAWEKPAAIEAKKAVHFLREIEWTELVRHVSSLFGSTPSSGLVGWLGGVYLGITKAVSQWVKEEPILAIPFGLGDAFLGSQVARIVPSLFHPGMSAFEALGAAALSTGLATGVIAVGTGIGHGLAARFGKKKDQEETRQGKEEVSLIKS